MRKILFSLAIICLIIFIGCLGTGTSGDVVGPGAYFKDAMLSGKVFFEDRQLYGGIPISVRYSGSPQENVAATLYTDNGGYFYLTYLEPGIYDLAAVTGESEVIFARGVQIVENVNRQINETALLCISDIIISNVEKDSFKISFHSNMGARSTLSYSNANGPSQTITINSSPSLLHEITINDLRQETQYELSLMLTSTTGQTFTMKGLNVNTAKIVGPNNMTISINNGAFETYSSAVNVYLNANNAKFMRFGETSDLSDSVWVSYSQTYTHTFSSMSEGTKRLFVQFKDEDGNISPVQSDSILLTTSGYVGVWLNGGETLTNNTQVTLRAIYPEATHIIISNTPNFLNSYWEAYSEQRFWKLSEEDGTKKVYVRFKGSNADENKIFTASIELDTTPPNVTMEINNGNEFTATTSVNLNFSYLGSPPSHMKISNTEAPENTSPWIEYQNPYSWTIPREDGEKTVYAIFKDTAGNEYGPVTAVITLDQTPPEGSSISIMSSSLADATKITSTTVNNLPIYLAFDITDDSVYKIYYAITSADADEPPIEQFTELNKPFVSVEIREDKQIVNGYFAAGNYKFWAYFADIADNRGYIQTANLYVDGPKITISPSSVNLTSGGRQTFTYSLENITTADTGTILWSVEPPTAGTITNNGIFTAKMPILEVSTANIIASSTNNVKYLQRAASQVILNTKMEVLYENASGAYIIEGKRYSYDPITINLENGGVATATIIMLHSDHGVEITSIGHLGNITTDSTLETSSYGTITKITYKAPLDPGANSEEITFAAINDNSITGSVRFVTKAASTFALDKTEATIQRSTNLNYQTSETITAQITNPAINSIKWTLASSYATFSPNSDVTTLTTTSPPHKVTVYATGTLSIPSESLLCAEANTLEKLDCQITILPNVSFSITPSEATILPLDSTLQIELTGFEFLHTNGTPKVKWYLKQKDESDFSASQSILHGSITLTDNSHITYTKPTVLPSKQTGVDNIIIIKAVSEQDNNCIATAQINLADDVSIEIYDNIDKTTPIASCSTVAEVGKKQFYAEVKPDSLTQKNITWSIVDANSTKGEISQTGLYTAPNVISESEITVRATSQYDTSAYKDIKVKLSNFWINCRNNMRDSVTRDAMPVSVLKVDPFSSHSENYVLYAGTGYSDDTGNMYGYGLWKAEFASSPTTLPNWIGIREGINNYIDGDTKQTEGKYIINDIAISSDRNVYVATAKGLYFYKKSATSGSYQELPCNYPSDNPTALLSNDTILSVVIDNSTPSDNRTVFVSTTNYILKLTVDESRLSIENSSIILDCVNRYRVLEMRAKDVPVPTSATETMKVEVEAYSYTEHETSVYGDSIRTMIYSTNDRKLYAAGTLGNIIIMNEACINSSNIKFVTSPVYQTFTSPNTDSIDTQDSPVYLLTNCQPTVISGGGGTINKLVQDSQHYNTLWFASTSGVYRSITSGTAWSSILALTNCRALIVDSTNTTNAMAGGETGVYRIVNGASTQITTGLGNHNIMLSLTQSTGAPGDRRRVWVGTSGGVFMGAEPLELQ